MGPSLWCLLDPFTQYQRPRWTPKDWHSLLSEDSPQSSGLLPLMRGLSWTIGAVARAVEGGQERRFMVLGDSSKARAQLQHSFQEIPSGGHAIGGDLKRRKNKGCIGENTFSVLSDTLLGDREWQ